jgi:hypothetical protein
MVKRLLPLRALDVLVLSAAFVACSHPESSADEYNPLRDGSVTTITDGGGASGADASLACTAEKPADCLGVCGGSAIVDSCGVCNGNDASKDCLGVCGGSAALDCSSVCNGPDAPDPYYPDADGDGLGDPKGKVDLCAPLSGHVTNGADCDDTVAGKCKPSLQLRFKRKHAGSAAAPYTRLAMAGLGDVDGDGTPDYVIGNRIVFINADGSFKGSHVITQAELGVTDLRASFGDAVAALGDVDGNGVGDVAIAERATPPNSGSAPLVADMGRVWTLLLGKTGAPITRTARFFTFNTGARPEACRFVSWGSSLASLDLNQDGRLELVVASSSDCINSNFGAGRIETFAVNANGSLSSIGKILYDAGIPYSRAEFEVATLASAGDANGDGTGDLVVATPGPSFAPASKLWTLFLSPTAQLVGTSSRLSAPEVGDARLSSLQRALTTLPLLPGAARRNVLVSLPSLTDRGGLGSAEVATAGQRPAYRVFYPREVGVSAAANDSFGAAAATVGDVDNDGLPEVAVLAPGDDTGGANQGALYTLGFAAECGEQSLRGDCNATASDGCETALTSDEHCGACGRSCTGAPNSSGGTCNLQGQCALTCTANFGDCNGDPRDGCETNLLTSIEHCGGCRAPCRVVDHRLPSCNAGACGSLSTCEGIWNDCNSTLTDGCESCGKCNQKASIESSFGPQAAAGIPNAAPCSKDQVCKQEFYQPGSVVGAPSYGRCVTECPIDRADCDGMSGNGCEANITLQSRCGGCAAHNRCASWEYLEYCVVNAAGTSYECR